MVNFLLIYTHYISGLVLFFQTVSVFVFFNNKNIILKYFSGLLLVFLLIFLRFTKKQFLVIFDFNKSNNSFWLGKSNIHYLKESMFSFFINEYIFIACFLIVLIVIFFTIKEKNKDNKFHITYLLLIGFGSIFILFLIGKVTPIFLDRYVLFSLPIIFIIIGYGFSLLKNKLLSYGVTLVFTFIGLINIDFKTDKKMDCRNALNFIKFEKSDKDLIIVKTKDIKPLFCYYYDQYFFNKQKNDLDKSNEILFCNSWQDININIEKYKRIIVFDIFKEYNLINENEFVEKLSQIKRNYYTTKYYKGITIAFYK